MDGRQVESRTVSKPEFAARPCGEVTATRVRAACLSSVVACAVAVVLASCGAGGRSGRTYTLRLVNGGNGNPPADLNMCCEVLKKHATLPVVAVAAG
jgi:hypothetical protein